MTGTPATVAASIKRGEKREKDDFYRTPPSATKALLAVESFPRRIWEPACGDGAVAKVLLGVGYDVIATDMIYRDYGDGDRDFLFERELLAPAIVTNPPFKLADEFVLHALSLGADKVAIFMRTAWLEGRARHRRLWHPHPPIRVWQFSGRQTLWRGDDPHPQARGGAIAFAWFVWQRGYQGAPSLGWLP